jgi:hypothetical protein
MEATVTQFKNYPSTCPQWLRKTTKHLSQDSQYLSQDSTWAPYKYKFYYTANLFGEFHVEIEL